MKKKVISSRQTPQGSIITLEDGSEELLEGAFVSLAKGEESQEVESDDDEEGMMEQLKKAQM